MEWDKIECVEFDYLYKVDNKLCNGQLIMYYL